VVACSNQAYQAGVPTTIASATREAATNVASSTRGVVRAIALTFRADWVTSAHFTADGVTLQVTGWSVAHGNRALWSMVSMPATGIRGYGVSRIEITRWLQVSCAAANPALEHVFNCQKKALLNQGLPFLAQYYLDPLTDLMSPCFAMSFIRIILMDDHAITHQERGA
jgi:hypothetical protein